ncbi:hypothetical protein MaudCBS49596_000561 [Microsporum audouinii]
MSFISGTAYSLPPLLGHVNARLLENPHPLPKPIKEPSTAGTSQPATPPWERSPNWELNEEKERMEREKGELRQVITECETQIAKLSKYSVTPNILDQDLKVLGHFGEDFRSRITQTLDEFRATLTWFNAESLEGPAVVTWTRTPEQRLALAKRLAEEKATIRLLEERGEYGEIVHLTPLEEGDYTKQQKEYWQVRSTGYIRRRGRLEEGLRTLRTLYCRFRSRKRNALRTDLTTAPSTSTRPTTRSQRTAQVAGQPQQQNVSKRRQRQTQDASPVNSRMKHNEGGGKPRHSPASEPSKSCDDRCLQSRYRTRRSRIFKSKASRRLVENSTSSSSSNISLRRSTRISRPPERFYPR